MEPGGCHPRGFCGRLVSDGGHGGAQPGRLHHAAGTPERPDHFRRLQHLPAGELPVAYVVSEGPLDENALKEALGRSLASFKCPRAFVRVDHLPRTALGKVQKHLLPPHKP
ncbi:MAG: hypothetical protein EBT95_03220 [Verrucomicrobia bacterium]|nr:hypothetical protein [Verrucomicrobiota bacterium]